MLYLIYFSVEVLHLCCDTGFFLQKKCIIKGGRVWEVGSWGQGSTMAMSLTDSRWFAGFLEANITITL